MDKHFVANIMKYLLLLNFINFLTIGYSIDEHGLKWDKDYYSGPK